MKKIIATIAALLIVAAFTTSCSKKCSYEWESLGTSYCYDTSMGYDADQVEQLCDTADSLGYDNVVFESGTCE